ncbi:hypothetical protein ABI_35570 [Asticcacaulis biprosthecium C19]|uniref:Uncharacterized protein n=1 Tax=Asticcacaulis biprosthecium C19 TaxID=715226 RepID=F4QQP7_9CAUL|nr:hypothetical protein [Asticcacaulis biprosthecium]EGF90534.1 hypothetical protein ABI_35570 [Asticcacaulis biprosthecium C19]
MVQTESLRDGDRVSHKVKGLGTVTIHPEDEDKIVPETEVAKANAGTVYVTWDDDRFPVAAVPRDELEKVPEAAAAISTGF